MERLGLVPGAVADPEVSVSGGDTFHGIQEGRADWAVKRLELNGKFALRQSTEVLGQAITVTSVISPDGLRITDDRGGSRIETHREFPVATCRSSVERFGCDGVVSFDMARDEHGTIVEFVRDSQGFPSGVRFGGILLLRLQVHASVARASQDGPAERPLARALLVGADRPFEVGNCDRLRRCRQGGL